MILLIRKQQSAGTDNTHGQVITFCFKPIYAIYSHSPNVQQRGAEQRKCFGSKTERKLLFFEKTARTFSEKLLKKIVM